MNITLKSSLFFACIYATGCAVFAQSIPAQLHISETEHRYTIGGAKPNVFYAIDSIKNIELIFEDDDWYEQMEINYYHEEEIPATMVYDGDTLSALVGVGFRGHSSYYQNDSLKKSIAISLDYIDSTQELFGYHTINLNCSFKDPSFMREVLYENLIQKYIPALSVNYTLLKLNGQDFGLYTNVEQLNNDFIREWFYTNDGTTWRAERNDGAVDSMPGGVDGTGFSSFNYLGDDSSDYSSYYTLKSTQKENPWEDLMECVSVLHNNGDAVIEDSINQYLDLDRTLWYLACEIIFADEDGYVAKGGMDYFIYWEPETDRIVPLEFDGNSIMEPIRYNWGVFLKSTDTNFALTYKLFAVPAIRQRYLAHVRTILEEIFNSEVIDEKIEYYHNLIDSYVEADPVKIYTYADYLNDIQELKDFVVNRGNYILDNWEVEQVAPIISDTKWKTNFTDWGIVNSIEPLIINTTLSGVPVNAVNLYYATGLFGIFTRVEMFDDGLHNDVLPNDNIYGASIPPFALGTDVRFYIEAVGSNTAGSRRYDPPGAEHDVYYYKVLNDFVGINEVNTNGFFIYPNPACKIINISTSEQKETALDIYNLSGQLIWSEFINGNIQIDIEAWKQGLYICKYGEITKKFMKE